MAAGVGPGQQWLTAGLRPRDEVGPFRLTSLPPALAPRLPSRGALCSPLLKLMDRWCGEEEGIQQANTDICCFDRDPCWPSLSRETPIISLSPDSCCPLNLLLSYSLHPAKSFVLLLLACRICALSGGFAQLSAHRRGAWQIQSLLTSLPCPSFKMNKQIEPGGGKARSRLATGNFLYFECWNWTLRGLVPDHWRALKRGRI